MEHGSRHHQIIRQFQHQVRLLDIDYKIYRLLNPKAFFFLSIYVFLYIFSNISACKDNLDSFINMDPGTGFGVVLTLDQLFERFHRPLANATAPRTPHLQPTPT